MDTLYNELVEYITRRTNENPVPISMGKFEGIGWIEMPYESAQYTGNYPTLVIKQYDKTVNLYVTLYDGDEPVAMRYASVFGKSAVGKTCIRIKKLNEAKLEALDDIIREAMSRK